MPEWLKNLLKQHGSLGYADTLSKLLDLPPDAIEFGKTFSSDMNPRYGESTLDAKRHVAKVDFTPDFERSYSEQRLESPYGTKLLPTQFGDHVYAHEMGHVASYGTNVGTEIGKAIGDKALRNREQFADHFSNATQFLRDHSTDTLKLDPESRQIMNVLLKQDIYKNHPLVNQAQKVGQAINH